MFNPSPVPDAARPPQADPRLQPCVKCGGPHFSTARIRTTGDGVSRFLNLQNQKFVARSCDNCGYTEFYRAETSTLGNVMDVLLGS